MLTSFWQGLGSKLAERWSSAAGGALVFWLGGVALTAWRYGFEASARAAEGWVPDRPIAIQVVLLIAALVVVVGSGVLVTRLASPWLRLLEGYGWPWWAAWPMVRWHAWRVGNAEKRYQRYQADLDGGKPSSVRRRRLRDKVARLEVRLRRFPAEADPKRPERTMPTRLGNVLRAAESLPADKYGLDAVVCWPRLWLCLPEQAREELVGSRAALDVAATSCLWGVLFVLWTPLNLAALPLGLGFAIAAYGLWMVPRAITYGVLVESTFDLYRSELYAALRWPLPSTPAEERAEGKRITGYLWRGSDKEAPTFERPAP